MILLRWWVSWICLMMCTPGFAREFRPRFVPNPNRAIPGLIWNDDSENREPKVRIKKGSEKEPPTYFVVLKGHYEKKDKTLLYLGKNLKIKPDGEFLIPVVLKEAHTHFSLTEIDERGNLGLQKEEIVFPEWEEFKKEMASPSVRKWSVSLGVGTSLIEIQQTGMSSFAEFALTPKLAAQWTILGTWEVGGSAFYTGAAVSTTSGGPTLQFLGANLRTGLSLLGKNKPWDLKLQLGYYYTTTFSGGAFGYQNLMGPQVFTVLRRVFSKDRWASVYLKYSTILDGMIFVSANNGEIAGGGGYTFPVFHNFAKLSVTLDIAALYIRYGGGGMIRINSYTVGASLGL